MKIQINKKTFENHLNNISSALNANSPLHSLQGVMITATSNSIQLTASNGNLSIKEEIPISNNIKVIEPGSILVPGRLFKEVIKKQEDEVEISVVNDSIEIISSDIKTNINLLNISDYPIINFDTFGSELIISVDILKQIIKNVAFAAAEGDKRIILNGVNLEASNGLLIASATNSFRLAQEKLKIDSNIEFNITILSRNLKNFIPTNATGELKISVNDSKIITRYKNTIIVSKLIDGVYPQISKLIPTEHHSEIKIKVNELDDLIEKATVVANENSKVVKLSIENNELHLESKRDEVGSTIAKSSAFEYNQDSFSIPFNAQFLKEAISKFKGTVVIEFTEPQKPFVVKGESAPTLIQLVLPHRTY